MIDITELYRYLVGIEAPWEVTGIELSEHEGRVDVSVGHPSRTRFPCPECGTELSVYDHTEDRAWRHLDSCGCLTYLHARTPRVTCPEHGTIPVRLPWAEPLSRFTTRFESWAVDQLSECSVTGAGRLLRTSWDETWGLMARAVARGQAVKEPSAPRHVGVDQT